MSRIEIPVEDLRDVDTLGDNPLYRFEELLNETNRNDLEMILNGYLRLDVNSNKIDDYEITNDYIVLYFDDEEY